MMVSTPVEGTLFVAAENNAFCQDYGRLKCTMTFSFKERFTAASGGQAPL